MMLCTIFTYLFQHVVSGGGLQNTMKVLKLQSGTPPTTATTKNV
jgi:hypothetical protein